MKNYILYITFLIFSTHSFGQESFSSQKQDSLNIWQLAKYDGASVLGGLAHTFTRPLHWGKKDWATFGYVAGGTALLYFVDNDTSKFIRRQEDSTPNVLKEFGYDFGAPQIAYGITSSVYLFGLVTKKERVRETGVLLISSAVAVGFMQTLLKTTVGRSRPSNDQGKFSFRPYSGMSQYRSFPSGHTVLSVTTAYAIAKQFKNPWVKTGIYAVGAITPLSRILIGAHWLTDVALSTALSIATVNAIDSYLKAKKRYPNGKTNGITWNFQLGLGNFGLTGTF